LCYLKFGEFFPEEEKKNPSRIISKKNKNFLKIFQFLFFPGESPKFVGKKTWACTLGSFEKLS